MTILDFLIGLINVAAVGCLAYAFFTVVFNSKTLVGLAARRFEHRSSRAA